MGMGVLDWLYLAVDLKDARQGLKVGQGDKDLGTLQYTLAEAEKQILSVVDFDHLPSWREMFAELGDLEAATPIFEYLAGLGFAPIEKSICCPLCRGEDPVETGEWQYRCSHCGAEFALIPGQLGVVKDCSWQRLQETDSGVQIQERER